MNHTSIMSILLLGVLPLITHGQHTQKLLSILNTPNEIKLTQKSADSFFKTSIKNIPQQELANSYHEYGKWFYKKRRSHKKYLTNAIFYTSKALSIKNKLKNTDPKSLKKTLYNLGVFNSIKQDFFAAIDYYEELIQITPLDSKNFSAYRELGYIYSEIGDVHKALNYSFELINKIANNKSQRKKMIQAYLNIIDTYSLMGYKEYASEIKKYTQKSDSLLSVLSIKKTKYYNRIYQAEGNRLLKIGHYKEAINNFTKVIENLHVQDSINLAIAHNSLGRSYYQLKNKKNALINFQKAISYYKTYTPTYENIGDLYIEGKEFKKGLEEYQKAINYLIGNVSPSSIISEKELDQAIEKYNLLHHLIRKANGYIEYYYFDNNNDHLIEAIKTFRLADTLVDIIRFESTEYKSKLYWREKASSLYTKAVEASFLLQKPEEAYYFMEKNKAILLLEDITNEQAKQNANLPQQLASREYSLKQKIHLSENKLNVLYKLSKDSIHHIQNEISQHKRTYEAFVDSLHIQYPNYAINKQKIKVLPYNTFKTSYTNNHELVLQYIINKKQGYGIVHHNKTPLFFKIASIDKLSNDIYKMNHLISSRFKNVTQQNNYYTIAHRIFKQLIPESVYQIIKGKNITIIPDHILQNLSFETLITSLETNNYLIKDTEIRYAYSMSYLDQNQQKKRKAIQKIIGIAPVKFNDSSLSSLPFSEKEITGIAALTNNETLLLKEQASKVNFIQSANQYQIIHLSTHASIEKDKTPWIAFRNQKMHLPEIYATKNQSEMVVLSACKTSLGELNHGEGVMSLARGFFYAGANSVVSSLWSVNDKANQELMSDFYKGIKQGHTKATALRKAKLNYINTHDGSDLSPFYWGSLILIGYNASIDLSSNTNNLYRYWIAICSIILTLLFLKLIYHKIKNSP